MYGDVRQLRQVPPMTNRPQAVWRMPRRPRIRRKYLTAEMLEHNELTPRRHARRGNGRWTHRRASRRGGGGGGGVAAGAMWSGRGVLRGPYTPRARDSARLIDADPDGRAVNPQEAVRLRVPDEEGWPIRQPTRETNILERPSQPPMFSRLV